ncbi:MAG: translation initiation factor IF-2 associated domain-containing protein, partial [Methylococcales bacterium]|nr:translation initiation factor IF-2 associated domain-containing protein [Methylococcales bacterium]
MSKVTVKQLAGVVGTPVERLLEQMKEAGIEVSGIDQAISDDEKMKLLDFLRQSHGKSNAEEGERKITLKRKSISELKVRGAGRSKMVNVEVRKKRTYVKRAAPKPEEIPEKIEEAPEPIVQPEVAEAPEPIESPEAPEIVESPETSEVVETPETSEVVESVKPAETPKVSKAPLSKSAQLAKQLEAETKALRQAKIDGEEATKKTAEAIRLKVAEKARLAEEQRLAQEQAKLKAEKTGTDSGADKSSTTDKPKTKARRKKTTSGEPTRYGRRELHAPGGTGRRKKKPAKRRPVVDAPTRHGFEKPTAPVVRELELGESISVVDMAQQLAVKSS